MEPVILTRRLRQQGVTANAVEGQLRRGALVRLRPGAYVVPEPTQAEADAAELHRRMVEATLPQLTARICLSYTSAAVLHGLPVWRGDLGSVHLTRPRTGGGGKRRTWITMHAQPLEAADVGEVDGIPVTSLTRTVFDLARVLPFERAVAAGDRALALGLELELLGEMLVRGRRWRGVDRARRTAHFIDGRAESAGESVSRVRCAELRLPPPQLQLPVRLLDGTTAYGDLGWPELRTIGEFDGRVKYEKLLRPGERASDVVVREKLREDQLRALGWQVVRWTWEELAAFGPTARQLMAAFELGRRSL